MYEELILNWDHTVLNIMPSSSWNHVYKYDSKQVVMVSAKDEFQIITAFCGTLVEDSLPIQFIFKVKPHCHPYFRSPAWWHVTYSPKDWSVEETMLQYNKPIIIPYI